MCQLPVDSHWAMPSHMAARARLIPAPELEPPVLRVVVLVLRVLFGLGAATGRAFVPTSTMRSTGALVTFEEIALVETTLPSTTVVRTVTVRTPATPAREALAWST